MASLWNIMIIFVADGFIYELFTVDALDTSRVRIICSGKLFETYYSHLILSEAIDDVLAHTPDADFHSYYLHQTCDPIVKICGWFENTYGCGKCTATLSGEECKSCMGEANKQLFHECTHSMGAQIQLKDCRLRYEIYDFTYDE